MCYVAFTEYYLQDISWSSCIWMLEEKKDKAPLLAEFATLYFPCSFNYFYLPPYLSRCSFYVASNAYCRISLVGSSRLLLDICKLLAPKMFCGKEFHILMTQWVNAGLMQVGTCLLVIYLMISSSYTKNTENKLLQGQCHSVIHQYCILSQSLLHQAEESSFI